jgi:hypothetical protein
MYVCAFVYVCMHACMHVYVDMVKQIKSSHNGEFFRAMATEMEVDGPVSMFPYTYIHTYMHTYIHTYTHACMHAYMLHTYINTYIHTYINTYIQTYIQTYIHTLYIRKSSTFSTNCPSPQNLKAQTYMVENISRRGRHLQVQQTTRILQGSM